MNIFQVKNEVMKKNALSRYKTSVYFAFLEIFYGEPSLPLEMLKLLAI